MEIHKPKPWHGWREFLKEYLIIVVGVLTALAAEQGVEWLHWRQQLSEAEAELQIEVRNDLKSAYERVLLGPCETQRISELASELRRPGATWRGMPLADSQATHGIGFQPRAFPDVYYAPTRPWLTATWDSERTRDALAHMDHDRQGRYALLYRSIDVLRQASRDEQAAIPALALLAFDTQIAPAQRNEINTGLASLDQQNQYIAAISWQMILSADKQGIRLPRKSAEQEFNLMRTHRGACIHGSVPPMDEA